MVDKTVEGMDPANALDGSESVYVIQGGQDREASAGQLRDYVHLGRTARVTAQFDKTNDTLANVPGLSVNVEAGRSYAFRAELYTTSDEAAGVKVAINGSCSVSSIIYEGYPLEFGLSVPDVVRSTTKGTAVAQKTTVTVARISIVGTLVCNGSGTLTVQFAQNVTNAIASSVLINSTFIIEPVS